MVSDDESDSFTESSFSQNPDRSKLEAVKESRETGSGQVTS